MAQRYNKHKGLLSFDLTYQETIVTKRRVKSIFQGVDYQKKRDWTREQKVWISADRRIVHMNKWSAKEVDSRHTWEGQLDVRIWILMLGYIYVGIHIYLSNNDEDICLSHKRRRNPIGVFCTHFHFLGPEDLFLQLFVCCNAQSIISKPPRDQVARRRNMLWGNKCKIFLSNCHFAFRGSEKLKEHCVHNINF